MTTYTVFFLKSVKDTLEAPNLEVAVQKAQHIAATMGPGARVLGVLSPESVTVQRELPDAKRLKRIREKHIDP